MSNTKIRRIKETDFGVYVWVTDDGRVVKDTEGNFMSISATRDDIRAQMLLGQAAKHYGIEGGRAVFWEGASKISDEEYEAQQSRLKEGYIPDPLDPGNRKKV